MTAARIPGKPGTYMRRGAGWDDEGWTSTPNRLIRDPAVEWDAKGAFTWIASHMELIFELDADKLAAAGPRGRNHAYEMLRQLEFHGWLTRSRYRAEDGKGTVHIWDIYPTPVAAEDRTWRPSSGERRKGYTGPDGTVVPGTDGPEIPDGRKFQKADIETAGQTGNPGRSGTPTEEPPGIPDRPGTDRPGIPYKEEKTKVEDQNPPVPRSVDARHHVHTASNDGGENPPAGDHLGPDATVIDVQPLIESQQYRRLARYNAGAHGPVAHELVTAWAAGCEHRPPREVVGELAGKVESLLRQGATREHVADGLAAWESEGMRAASQLPRFVHRAANRPQQSALAGRTRSRGDIAAEQGKAAWAAFRQQAAAGPRPRSIEGGAS